jgi:Dyp-type peroxidase family
VLEFGDIQGLVFSGYQAKPCAYYVMLRVSDVEGAKRWLRAMAQLVTTGRDRPPDTCVNLALSAAALTALGMDEDTFHTFPLEFREGLAGSETRSRTLGDTGDSTPSRWRWGSQRNPVHVLLMLYARTPDLLQQLVLAQRRAFEGAFTSVFERTTETLPRRREHFGFADGIAQPVVERGDREGKKGARTIKAGEFILGQTNEYDRLPFVPNAAPARDVAGDLADCEPDGRRKAVGRNGSYLVVRQLEQHVFAFWDYMRQQAQRLGPGTTAADGAVYLAAKCVGRWPSGTPLVKAPNSDDSRYTSSDDFGYFWKDRDGARCPIGAHIRRTNPRDSLEPDPFSSEGVVDRHRILRRGRSYGQAVEPLDRPWMLTRDDGEERGLFFVCLNANIRRQFEFIQQTWVNNPKFGGLYDERDPLIGTHEPPDTAFSIPSTPARARLEGLPRFVDVRGGEYFFLPSVRALKFLASMPAANGRHV